MNERILGERYLITSSFFESNNIFQARDVDTQENVLVKIVSLLPKEQKRWTKFESELRIISQLNHPGIIKIKEWGDCDGGKYIAFEQIDGIRLSEAKLSMSSNIRVLLRVAEAIKSMHSVELVHRELRPENIVLYDQTNLLIKFFDFGTSASEETKLRLIKPNEIIKTLSWISPEALRNDPITLSSNLYQFGLICFKLLTGTMPYKEDTPSSLIWQIQHMNPTPISSINPRVPIPLDNAIKRLLRKDPETRYESIDEVIEILLDLAKQENISSTFSIRTGLLMGRGRIVGRTKEITKISASLKVIERAEIFNIKGGLGIGKTRLLQEIESQARITDIPTAIVGCDDHHASRDLSLISQIVYDCANQIGIGAIGKSPHKNILTRISPELGKRMITADTSDIDIYELEKQAIPALSWLIDTLSKRNHLLIIIDDAQCIDTQSDKLLKSLFKEIAHMPVTILFASEKNLAIDGAITVELEPLTRKDVSIMLHENIGFLSNADELLDACLNISKGNPLILELIISGLATNKGIDDSGKLLIHPDTIPKKIPDLLSWQLPKLSQSVQDVLAVASIIGSTFEENILESVTGKPKHEIADSLDMGMLANIISHYKSPSGYRYRFISGEMVKLLSETLNERQKIAIHESLIRKMNFEKPDDLDIWNLIHHLRETNNTKTLIDQLIRASKMTARRQDIDSAIELAREAYSLSIKTADTIYEAKSVINYCDFLCLTGEWDRSIELLEGILKTGKKIGIDQLSESDLLYNIAFISHWQGNTQKSQECSQESFKIISRIGDDERMISLHSLESAIRLDTDIDLSLRQAQKAVQLCDKYPESEFARQSYSMLAISQIQSGNLEAAKTSVQKAKNISKNNSNLLFFYATYLIEAQIDILEGNIADANEIVNNIEKESTVRNSIPLKISVGSIKSQILASQAKHDDAIVCYQELVSMALQINSEYIAIKILIRLCQIFIEQGKMDGAKYSLFQAQNMANEIQNTGIANSISLLQAMIYYGDGDSEKSLETLSSISYIKLPPLEKFAYKILFAHIYAKKGEYRKSMSFLAEDNLIGKQVNGLPAMSYMLNISKADILMCIIGKAHELTLAQRTLFFSKHGLLGQDLHGQAKQALDIAYINTLYSGDRTQQPKAAFELARYHCLMTIIDASSTQNHKDECMRLMEMANALANELNMSTLIIRIQNLELALKTGKLPVGI